MDVSNVKIGPAKITYGSTEVGHTLGGSKVAYEQKFADIKVDYYGDTPVDRVLTGEGLTVKVKLAESTLENLKACMPFASLENSGQKNMLSVGSIAGQKASANVATLVLHPTYLADNDTSEDVVMYKAVSTEPIELNYEYDNERVYEVTFVALIDESKEDGNLLGHFGDWVS